MNIRKRLLLAGATSAIVFAVGCSQQGGNAPSPGHAATVDAATIARADALISQPAWLRERLPEHTAAYLRIPTLWGTLSAPDGRPLDVALANEQHARLIAALRKAAQNDPTLTQAGAGPLLNILLGDQSSPIELALVDASDGVSPYSRALVTTVLDVPDVAALNARIAALNGNGPSPLKAPIDANGDASLQQSGALHFDAATHRLFLSLGTTASATTLEQDLAQVKTTRASPMQDDEKEIDASGQGLFAWMSTKGFASLFAERLQGLPPDSVLRDALEHTKSVAFGWGTVDGHGRLQVQVRAPQARLLGYLAANAGDVALKTAGTPEWAASMALPGQEKLQQIHDNLDRDYGAGVRASYDSGAAKLQESTTVDPIAFLGLFGRQVVMFGDANGSFTAIQVRDRKALYAKLDELSQRFGWRNTVVKAGGGEIHHLHIALPDSQAPGAGLDPRSAAWLKIYTRIGADYYWIEEGDYLVSAKVPQPLIDRMASKPDASLSDWLHRNQSYDNTQTLLGYTTTTHNVDRAVYYTYLGLLDDLGNALGAPVDLSTLPTARQLGLPAQGIAGIAIQANDQRLAVQLNYEQSPLEGMVAGEGNAMTTVAVAAILAAIAIPAYQDYVIRSQVSEGASLSEGAKVAVAEFYSSHARMPRTNMEAGIAISSNITGAYTSSVSIENGRITVTYGGGANSVIKGDVLVFGPQAQGQSIHWTCTAEDGTTIPAKYLPTVCRH